MRDLTSPLLSLRVVSVLTGLSPQAIRRWESYGVPLPPGAGGRPRAVNRMYSWRDVEQLQQATHLVESRGVSMGIAGLLLDGEVSSRWVIARPKPRTRAAVESRVVAVGLPRSAERRPHRATGRPVSAGLRKSRTGRREGTRRPAPGRKRRRAG